MKEVIAIRHVAFEHLGILAPVLSGRGYRVRYLEAGVDDLAGLDLVKPALLVILGGPIGAREADQYPFLAKELRLIERRLEAKRPILGICLGAQLMAMSLGSRVYTGKAKEVGWLPIQLTPAGKLSCLEPLKTCDYRVLHWHGDTFDLPSGARCLASSELTENQAFALGEYGLGLQFHLEVQAAEIERWLVGHAHEIAAVEGVEPRGIRADTQRFGPALASSAVSCFQHWLSQARL